MGSRTDGKLKVGSMVDIDTAVKESVLEFAQLAVREFEEEEREQAVPGRLVSIMNVLSAAIAVINTELGPLENEEVRHFLWKRPGCTSDKQARMIWQASDKGQRQTELKFMMKAMDKIQSACKNSLRHYELEARNQY